MDADRELKKIKEEILNCRKCFLYETRKYPVIGEGSHRARVMFIGEAPGMREDMTGRPFCGAAGKILDKLLDSAGIARREVYIANILKCRPPNNRDPREEEIEACAPYLERQIKILKPEIICSLGRYSMEFLMEEFGLKERIGQISKIHGKIFETEKFARRIKIIPFFHPAVAVYNQNMNKILEKDFKILKKI